MIAPLLSHIQKYILLTLEEQKIIEQHVKYTTTSKKQHLFSEGDLCNAQYFVIEGCLRMYFIKDNGVEQIVQFGIDNCWISDYTSLTLNTPSQFYLQAVQPSCLVVLTKDKLDALFNRCLKWNITSGAFINAPMQQHRHDRYIFPTCRVKKSITTLPTGFLNFYSVYRNTCWPRIWVSPRSF
jgi:CRP-like cAMP-binding protein